MVIAMTHELTNQQTNAQINPNYHTIQYNTIQNKTK